MSNEQIVTLRQFALIGLLATAFVVVLFYIYWQQTKAIAAMFKGTIVALLIALGIYDDTDNNNSAST